MYIFAFTYVSRHAFMYVCVHARMHLYMHVCTSGVVGGERGGTAFPHFFLGGERDPPLFCSISAEIIAPSKIIILGKPLLLPPPSKIMLRKPLLLPPLENYA